MPKMSESSFVTVDIESPVAVPVKKQMIKLFLFCLLSGCLIRMRNRSTCPFSNLY